MKNILAIVAHPDDEIIGLGGTLYKHVLNGDHVEVLILAEGKTSRADTYKNPTKQQKTLSNLETSNALECLGIKKFHKEFLPDNRFDSLQLLDLVKIVSNYIKKTQPSIVYTHHFGDLNIDHQKTSEATIIACRPIENKFVEKLLMFETLSATEMAGYRLANLFMPNLFINIENELERKLKAMSCYKSELNDFPHPRSLKAIELNAKLWGTKNNMEAAEAFYIFREIRNKI